MSVTATTGTQAAGRNSNASDAATDTTTAAARAATGITATDTALLLLRLALGVIFFAHGAQKVLGWWGGPGLAGTVGFMGGMGIPAPLAYLAAFTEFGGGLALIFGVLSRLASLGLAVTMLVAIAKVHLANGFFMGGKAPGMEYNIALLAMALAIALAGPGRLAVGDWERRFLARRG